jgi:hypothetical protein
MIYERWFRHLPARAGIVVIGLAALGCSNNSAEDTHLRQPVAGLVLVDGRAMPRGSILFFPAHHPVWGATVSAGDVIHDGRFSIPWEKGLSPGYYRIAISAEGKHRRPSEPKTEASKTKDSKTDLPKIEPPKTELTRDEMIPIRFNVETELEVEVKEGGIQNLKIEIDSK